MKLKIGTIASSIDNTKALFAGGYIGGANSAATNIIGFVTVSTAGNTTNFGNLTNLRSWSCGVASYTRGVFAGGNLAQPGGWAGTNVIDYVTIATAGNATSFGTLASSKWSMASCSSQTRGVFAGADPITTAIDYITIATTGNSTSFGSLGTARRNIAGVASQTRGVFAGGETSGTTNTTAIEYITIATTGNSTSFGTLTVSRAGMSSCSSSTRGVFAGGSNPNNTTTAVSTGIEYITIATTGNSTNFGNLTVARAQSNGCSSRTRGLFGGGRAETGNVFINSIESVMIATTGNATNFGNLYLSAQAPAALSNGHGGL